MTTQLSWDGQKFVRRYVDDWKIIAVLTISDDDLDVMAFGEMLKRHSPCWYTVPDATRKP